MILFHGSEIEIKNPDLEHSRKNVDFGNGFYLTPIFSRAEKWSMRFKKQGKNAVVSSFFFDESHLSDLKVLNFDGYSENWLDFIMSCRKGNDETDFDIVIGGVANDKVFNTIELFFDNLIDKNEAIKRLQFEKPNLQYAFRTQKALDKLSFKGSEKI